MNKICFVEIPIVSEKQFKLNALSIPVGDSYDVWEPGLSRGICNEYKSIMFNCLHPARVKLKQLNLQDNFSPLNRIVFYQRFECWNCPSTQIE